MCLCLGNPNGRLVRRCPMVRGVRSRTAQGDFERCARYSCREYRTAFADGPARQTYVLLCGRGRRGMGTLAVKSAAMPASRHRKGPAEAALTADAIQRPRIFEEAWGRFLMGLLRSSDFHFHVVCGRTSRVGRKIGPPPTSRWKGGAGRAVSRERPDHGICTPPSNRQASWAGARRDDRRNRRGSTRSNPGERRFEEKQSRCRTFRDFSFVARLFTAGKPRMKYLAMVRLCSHYGRRGRRRPGLEQRKTEMVDHAGGSRSGRVAWPFPAGNCGTGGGAGAMWKSSRSDADEKEPRRRVAHIRSSYPRKG